MRRGLRAGAMAFLVLLGAASLPSPRAGSPLSLPCGSAADAASCGKCHVDQHREWAASAHARAFTDPIYQRSLVGKARPELCHGCHVPESVLARLGRPPEARTTQLADGVGCAACHLRGDTVHGPFGAQTDAHRSERDPTFSARGATALCASCHSTKIGPVLPVARDFAEAGLEAQERSCVGCHMPELERPLAQDPATSRPSGPARANRSHEILGPNHVEFCAKAFQVQLRTKGNELVVAVTNAAGHRVPGLTLRRFLVRVRQLDASGRELRKEPTAEISATRELRVGETREIRFLASPGLATVEISIDHVFSDKLVATILERTLKP